VAEHDQRSLAPLGDMHLDAVGIDASVVHLSHSSSSAGLIRSSSFLEESVIRVLTMRLGQRLGAIGPYTAS
jgi:hypothetical protein